MHLKSIQKRLCDVFHQWLRPPSEKHKLLARHTRCGYIDATCCNEMQAQATTRGEENLLTLFMFS